MRRAAIILGLLAALLVGAWYAFCIWCRWWQRTEPPACHPSWSAQQKYELLVLDHELRYNPICAVFGVISPGDGISRLEQVLSSNGTTLVWGWRRFCKPAREALHKVMATGRGDVYTADGYPVALYALRFHKVELVKALVEHGCDPAVPYIAWDAPTRQGVVSQSNLLVDTLAGCYMDYSLNLSSRKKLELLDFLARHGATIDTVPDGYAVVVNAAGAACGHSGDGGTAIAWLLRRGLQLNDELKPIVQKVLHSDECRETREALSDEGLLPVENAAQ